jgi:23S rRNA-/tRNA-specific pseudouridylate synthase
MATRKNNFKKRGQTPFLKSDGHQLSVWEGTASLSEPVRADKYLSETLALMSRSQLKARGACLFCNGKEVKLSHKIKNGDHLRLEWTEAPSEEITPEPVPLTILYRDADVFVIDKPQGMVTHPAAGNWSGTLANGILWLSLHGEDARATGLQTENEAEAKNELELNRESRAISESKSEPEPEPNSTSKREPENEPIPFYTSFRTLPLSPPPRAGIVHRLDKDTSGVIIVARTARAHEFLCRQFHDREARKEYLAIVRGAPPTTEGRIDTWLARSPRDRKKFAVSPSGRGKHALTLYKVRAIWEIPARAEYAAHTESASSAESATRAAASCAESAVSTATPPGRPNTASHAAAASTRPNTASPAAAASTRPGTARASEAPQSLSRRGPLKGSASHDGPSKDSSSKRGPSKKATSPQRYTLVALYPRTGRTHQLRVHMAHLGCPILGDPIYSKKDPHFPDASLMLHARRLKIRLPADNEFHIFAAPLPEHFKHMIAMLDAQGIRRRAST